jgi:hypothetical protein
MTSFIQSLESRTLFAFADDYLAIAADAAAGREAMKAAASVMRADLKEMTVAVRAASTPANRASNAGELRLLKADVTGSLAELRASTRRLFGRTTAVARRVATTAGVLQSRPGNLRLQARLASALSALGTVSTTDLVDVDEDLSALNPAPTYNILAFANPSVAPLAAAALANVAGAVNSVDAAVTEFAADLETLFANAGNLPTGPQLVGRYIGTARDTTGPFAGVRTGLEVQFQSQAEDGSLTGLVGISEPGEALRILTLTGTVTEAGVLTGTLAGPDPEDDITLTGTVIGNTITGTYTSPNGVGTFTIRRQN